MHYGHRTNLFNDYEAYPLVVLWQLLIKVTVVSGSEIGAM